MAKIEGEPPKQPGATPPPLLVTWSKYSVSWLGANNLIDLPPQATKATKTSQKVLAEGAKRAPSEPENFQHNSAFILKITSQDLKKLTVKDGKLAANMDDPKPDKAKQLIKQTIRQARGRLIDAQHGYVLIEKALYELNKLNEHVRKFLPECVEKDPSSPVRILTGAYQPLREPTQKERAHASAIIHKTLERRRATDQKVKELVTSTRNLETIPTPSFTKPKFVTSSGERVAVEKVSTERFVGKMIAASLEKDPETQWKRFAPMGGVNELIASNLNVLLGGKFGIPLATRKGETTIHALADNIGSLYELREESEKKGEKKQDFLKTLPLLPCQEFILGQLALGGFDCHADNVLFDAQMHPIAIDFGRSLGPDPDHPECNLAACYLDWPAMDAPLSKEDLGNMKKLDIDEVIKELQTSIETQYSDLLKDFDLKVALMATFLHLEARLIALQEAARAGMTTLREMTALFLPPISEEFAKRFDQIDDTKIHEQLVLNIKYQGFKLAFFNADPIEDDFQIKFRELIREEIGKYKGKTKKELYGPSSQRCYQRCKKDKNGARIGFQFDQTSNY